MDESELNKSLELEYEKIGWKNPIEIGIEEWGLALRISGQVCTWAEGLSKTTSLPPLGRGKVCVPSPDLTCGFTLGMLLLLCT